MKKTMWTTLLLLFSFLSGVGVAAPPDDGSDWRTVLKEADNKSNLGEVIGEALNSCVAPCDEIVRTAIDVGHNPYEVIKAMLSPNAGANGCVCKVIRGAKEAGVAKAVISKAATDADVNPFLVERAFDPPAAWRPGFERTLKDKGLGQAVADTVGVCIPPADVVRTAISMGQDSYLVVRAVIHVHGECVLCEITDLGIPCSICARAAFDAAAKPPEQAGLGYTAAEGEKPRLAPPLPPPPASPSSPK